ncbi:glyoxalase [Chryseobacterium sp. MP_3.2]|uniref:glyoxalase n=1 Tax=Chryseobacterium sp. MP_3.2 TaxID=3071712 RepID=UPI002DF76000|nr:glutathione synthase/RimK-type ligase-like ATP-grasp enzyme [Chryseobacterium sp. MP_3.2]
MSEKIALRPDLNIENLETTSPLEQFQNQTLRPILKLQNDLFVLQFQSYSARMKSDYHTLSSHKKSLFIEQSLQKDLVLKNTFIGMTLGMFTTEEFQNYLESSKELNRRIITMLIERLKNQLC